MPTTLAGHVAKHCSHVLNSPDENNNIGGVHTDVYKCSFFPKTIKSGIGMSSPIL